jgi:benzoyl-CoA-dihydrodiol lyase
MASAGQREVSFDASPASYRHWRLRIDGEIAYLVLDVDEHGGLVPGYELKLNSYDLGVDIELHDAVQRLRFEHPEVHAVVLTSGKDRVFSAGANIRMLAGSSHEWKVNFCKFTNETRNGFEDATEHSGLPFLAAVNGSCAGGGYELALACEQILLVDDNSSAVALPELPLLGVLPGTGGLTRVVDKRRVRRDLADVFATRAEGVRGRTAVQWRLVDEVVPPRQFDQVVRERAGQAAARSTRPSGAAGIELTPLRREVTADALRYEHVTAELDRGRGLVTLTLRGPATPAPATVADVHAAGAAGWLLALTRELDDAILRLRTNEPELGTWLLRSEGDAGAVLAHERVVLDHAGGTGSPGTGGTRSPGTGGAYLPGTGGDWLCNEIVHFAKRTAKRLDVTSRSLIALIEPGSCFAGLLLDLALACDRQYILDGPPPADEGSAERAAITLSEWNFGPLPTATGLTRLAARFYRDEDHLARLAKEAGRPLPAAEALELGLVTAAPDDLDWDEEIRIVVEERTAFSPDALTGMEANYRFVGPETVESKVFGRLSAWQNWVFSRPNAAGERGALRRYGTGQRAEFDRKRV